MKKIIGWILIGIAGGIIAIFLDKAGYGITTWQFYIVLMVISFCSTVGNELIDKNIK